MWKLNTDNGKWSNQTDKLSKINYDSLKQDLQKVRLYSKCLSGATYLPIHQLNDIYDVLSINKDLVVSESNYVEFYNKYLKEGAFTLKNLFTPTKLINDQLNNFLRVDVATTESLISIGSYQPGLIIDGINLKEGHRVLVKNQTTRVTLDSTSPTFNPESYFSSVVVVSNYNEIEQIGTDIVYEYYNSENGIYKYVGSKLIRETDLDDYETAYRHSVSVKLGDVNKETEYHLARLKTGYYPLTGENTEFINHHNWVLRNRVDYNNIYDINYYDVIHHSEETIYSNGYTHSIPERTIGVGEFGVIIDNQDPYSATYSYSHIIENKYKVNLRSISTTSNFYWVCGDDGTLLRISKVDFSIIRCDINELTTLTSISFFDDLRGIVVGKFNIIYYTEDGGYNWKKIQFSGFESYSYNNVIYYSINTAFIGGEAGVFIELNNVVGGWTAYKRRISKQLSSTDEYLLVDDINDMSKTDWVRLISKTYSLDSTLVDFNQTLVFNSQITDNWINLGISVNTPYSSPTFSLSEFYVSFKITDLSNSNIIFNGTNSTYDIINPLPSYNEFEIWQFGTVSSNLSFNVNLPIDGGNLKNSTYLIESNLVSNYNAIDDSIDVGYTQNYPNWELDTKKGDIVLISTNNNNVLFYDVDSLITPVSSQFVYCTFSNSLSDIMSIERKKSGTDVYIGGSSIYSFDFKDVLNIGTVSNSVSVSLTSVLDKYVNNFYSTSDNLYLAGNNSVLGRWDYSDFYELDNGFNSRIKSQFLILDYDIASKLNFFDDNGDYRLPTSTTFSVNGLTLSNGYFGIDSLSNEYNWLDYYRDSEKSFGYNTSMNNSNSVRFSSTFSYGSNFTTTYVSSDITTTFNDIKQLAPSIGSPTASKYISIGSVSAPLTIKGVYLYKWLSIFRVSTSFSVSIGDVLYLESDVVDCDLLVNRIETFGSSKYIYCFSDFNGNIINNIKSGDITITNLNRYSSISQLLDSFEKHPISNGYELSKSGDIIELNSRFNNKTAYYNLQSQVTSTTNLGVVVNSMTYSSSFLNFGYSPTYNLLDYLSKINTTFTSTKEFTTLPVYYNLTGNGVNSFSSNNLYLDYTINTNKIYFGSDYLFQWTSFLLNTFVDLELTDTSSSVITTDRLLIVNKYYDSTTGGYVLEFHKKINVGSNPIDYFSIISRRTLQQISDDLQLLNNIQRTTVTKEVEYLQSFDNLENELRSKFYTDSYFKAIVSDSDIRKFLSAIIYTDDRNQVAMNVINVSSKKTYTYWGIGNHLSKAMFNLTGTTDVKVGDYVIISGSSSYAGLQTVTEVFPTQIVTSKSFTTNESGKLVSFKADPFFNYQPVDIFDLGADKMVTRSVEILPENFVLEEDKYNLINLDLTNYKMKFVDGLYLEEITKNYSWLLEAEVSNAVIGRDSNGLIWYSGDWKCGRWFGGTWISGRWVSGDWYEGVWKAFNTTYQVIKVDVDTSYVDDGVSKWYNGRWYGGTWSGGTWYNGRRYDGDWLQGYWYNGIWNDGHWFNGQFLGGIWVLGKWEKGLFNCSSKPAFWLDGEFISGDFENGIWYNGKFGNQSGVLSRFGTKASNSRIARWNGGKWLMGEFHSYLNTDSQTGVPIVSDVHKYSIWNTGIWYGGNWYGGIAYSIDFRSGNWYGGIVEDIQVIGVDAIYPATYSNNSILLNGIFRFNIGDDVWIVDDYNNGSYSPIGSTETPSKYRVNKVSIDLTNSYTTLYLNYNLSTLGVPMAVGNYATSSIDTGLKVVTHFKDSDWYSGIWTNGVFDGGNFYSGIWYNGYFNGTWGL